MIVIKQTIELYVDGALDANNRSNTVGIAKHSYTAVTVIMNIPTMNSNVGSAVGTFIILLNFKFLHGWLVTNWGHTVLWHQHGGHHERETTYGCLIWRWFDWWVNPPTEFCAQNPGCQTRWKLNP
jgi:hypothetical protein